MGRRTAAVKHRAGSRALLGAPGVVLGLVLASGCVLGGDNDRPVLAVDPLWDVTADDTFFGRTCDRAGVVSMTWAIQDDDGDTIERSRRREDCAPFDFYGLRPGTYQLELTGYDADGQARWSTTCTGLELGRFDVLYKCEVEQTEPEPPDETGDAGTDSGEAEPDAG